MDKLKPRNRQTKWSRIFVKRTPTKSWSKTNFMCYSNKKSSRSSTRKSSKDNKRRKQLIDSMRNSRRNSMRSSLKQMLTCLWQCLTKWKNWWWLRMQMQTTVHIGTMTPRLLMLHLEALSLMIQYQYQRCESLNQTWRPAGIKQVGSVLFFLIAKICTFDISFHS